MHWSICNVIQTPTNVNISYISITFSLDINLNCNGKEHLFREVWLVFDRFEPSLKPKVF